MTKLDQSYFIIIYLLIGVTCFFAGAIFQQGSEQIQEKEIEDLTYKLKIEVKNICFWKNGYMERDSVLYKISNHKDCTFELRKIIGGLE